MCCGFPNFVKQPIGDVAGAVGGADVAVAEDGRQRRDGIDREVGVLPTGRRQSDCAPWVDVVQAQPPANQPAERVQLDRRRRHVVEVADHRHTPAVAVEAAGVVALHGPGQRAGPALEYLAVLVDQCVVGDVAPAEDLGVIRVDRLDDRRRVLRLVVVALGGVVDHRGADRLVERPVSAVHRFVGAPLGAGDDVGRLARRDDRGRRCPLGIGGCLRRGNENGRDVLRQRLFRGGRDVAQAGGRRGLRRDGLRCAGRAADRDLHRRGFADEYGIGAARTRCRAVVARREQCLGLVPRAPRAVGVPGADPRGGAGEVSAGQRDHGKRCGLADFADRDAAAEADQRLLGEVGVAVPGRLLPMFARRPRQDDHGRRDGGEQHRRRGAAGRHHPMLRMCLLVQMFRHAT